MIAKVRRRATSRSSSVAMGRALLAQHTRPLTPRAAMEQGSPPMRPAPLLDMPPTPPSPEAAAIPVDPEREWLEKVYRPGARQLTPRAVLSGMVIGAVMCLSNLYVILK